MRIQKELFLYLLKKRSELDAMLIQQYGASLVCCIAIGGVSRRPDQTFNKILVLEKAPLVLLSLDFNEAGKKQSIFWVRQYPNLRLWPTPTGKSLGDAIKEGKLDVFRWLQEGLWIR